MLGHLGRISLTSHDFQSSGERREVVMKFTQIIYEPTMNRMFALRESTIFFRDFPIETSRAIGDVQGCHD